MGCIKGSLTIIVPGKPGSNWTTFSKYSICSADRVMSSAVRLESRCSTLRPPRMGKTYGALERT
jgi:hypothetical protein